MFRPVSERDIPAGNLILGQMRGRALPVASARFAMQLASSRNSRLDVMLLNQSEVKRAEIAQQLAEHEIESNVYAARSSSALIGIFGQFTLGTVLLPATAAEWLDEMETNVIVVP